MKKIVRRVIIVYLAILIMTTGNVFADQKTPLEVKVKVGFEGEYKFGYHVPITLEIINDKKDINGEIQFETENQTKNFTIYAKPINIKKGEKKSYTLNVPIYTSIGVKIRIMEGKNNLYEAKPQIGYGAGTDSYLIGILSDDFDSVNYFSYKNRYSRSAKLNEKNFPESREVMNMFDTILINNFDTSRLKSRQYEVLKEWVQAGGTLIIGTGPTHSKALSIFKDNFISIKVNGIKDIKTNAIYDFIGKKEAVPMGISTANIEIKESGSYLGDTNNTIISHLQCGNGSIYISSFDFGLKPLADWDNNTMLGGQLVVNTSSLGYVDKNQQQYMNYTYGNIQGALMVIPDLPNPNPWGFIIISLVYIIIAGPVSYIILKKKDKRGYMWLTIPVSSIIFCFIMYFSGLGTRLNKPIANVISIVDITGEEDLGLDTIAGIFTPVKKDITVETEVGMDISSIAASEDNYMYAMYNPNNTVKTVDSKFNYSSRTSVEFFKNNIWSMRTLVLKNDKVAVGDFNSKINYVNGNFTGTIRNTTGMDLEECFILLKNRYINVGPIKNGDTKSFNTFGVTFYQRYDILRLFDTGVGGMMPGAMMPGRNISNDKIIEMRRKQQNQGLMQYYLSSDFKDKYEIKILGIGTKPISKNILVDKRKIKKYEKVLLISECAVNFKNGNKVEYPSYYFKPVILSSNFPVYNQYDEVFHGTGTAEFKYELDENVNVEEISFNSHILSSKYPGEDVKGYLWNYITGSWDEGRYNSYTLRSGDVSKYLGDKNIIKYKIESKDNTLSLNLPCISMRGSVK